MSARVQVLLQRLRSKSRDEADVDPACGPLSSAQLSSAQLVCHLASEANHVVRRKLLHYLTLQQPSSRCAVWRQRSCQHVSLCGALLRVAAVSERLLVMSAPVDAASAAQTSGAAIDLSLPAPVYHEKQSLMRCGVHSLNNLVRHRHSTGQQLRPLLRPPIADLCPSLCPQFQRPLYDKASFDAICDRLSPDSWINPHRSVLGLGSAARA